MDNPFAGETAFPIAGERCVLKFRTKDVLELHSAYGPDPRQVPRFDDKGRIVDHFWTIITRGIETHDPGVVFAVLKAGLKYRRDDGNLHPVVARKDVEWSWDDLPFAFAEISDAIMAALMWSRWAKTPEQLAEEIRQDAARFAEEAGADAGPDPTIPTAAATTSSGSSEQDTATA